MAEKEELGIPPKRLLFWRDLFTRIDELLEIQIRQTQQLREAISQLTGEIRRVTPAPGEKEGEEDKVSFYSWKTS